MINYIELGSGLHDEIEKAGHWIECRDGQWISSNDVAVQAIIDSYDPLVYEIKKNIAIVKDAAIVARSRYVTPGKDLVYELKRLQAIAYKNDGYPADTSAYPLIQAESNATGKTPVDAANYILTVADGWMTIAAQIEQIEREAVTFIESATDWKSCAIKAKSAIEQLNMI